MLRSWYVQAQVQWVRLTLLADPYTKSVEQLKIVMPLSLAYFQTLRWQSLTNLSLILVSVPHMLAWTQGWEAINDTLITPSSGWLVTMIPTELYSVSMPILYVVLFAITYAVLFLSTIRRIFADLQMRSRSQLKQGDDKHKFSRVVLNSWNSGISSRVEREALGKSVTAALKLIKAQEEQFVPKDDEWGDEEEQQRLRWVRGGEVLANLILIVSTWTLLEVFLPSDTIQYPQGIERLVGPIIAACVNVLVIPVATHHLVALGRYPPRLVAQIEYVRVFLGRFANIIVVLRRQFLFLQDTGRVWRGASLPMDACYCEDEVGVNLVWYWVCDWIAIMFKCGLFPLLKAAAVSAKVVKSRHQSVKPSFMATAWLVDHACNNLLLMLSLPFYPVAGLLAQGAGIVGFYVQRVCVVNLWEYPKKIVSDPKQTKFAFSLVSLSCLVIATMAYFFVWVYVSTDTVLAPICKVALLYENATAGDPCYYDATTLTTFSAETSYDCAPYLSSACAGRASHGGGASRPLFLLATPAATMASLMQDFVDIIGTPLLAWAAAIILFLRFMVQRNYRVLFQEYVEEKRYRLLIDQSNLERALKKQDRLLAIQRMN
uniref:TMC domain-containing protein n=2 Tax=Hemiselmis andersenii TaxID=464988 RepID=A0A7S1HM89_HEMAN